MTQQNLKTLFQSSYNHENFISLLQQKFNFSQAEYGIPKLENLREEQKIKIKTFEWYFYLTIFY